MSTPSVGIRELKDHLSEYVRRARQGEEILITSHGEIVAALTPYGRATSHAVHPGIARMVQLGMARGGQPNDPSLYRPSRIGLSQGSVLELLDEERGER
ncbi:MAG: type II toxin-antitoxin system prevent-host-death family antitoxin [Acidobacteria bacterium]|nr:type II toxin-antitoxin system prevent-host-death family antitoxin [Acidobacteriota bacterium]